MSVDFIHVVIAKKATSILQPLHVQVPQQIKV